MKTKIQFQDIDNTPHHRTVLWHRILRSMSLPGSSLSLRVNARFWWMFLVDALHTKICPFGLAEYTLSTLTILERGYNSDIATDQQVIVLDPTLVDNDGIDHLKTIHYFGLTDRLSQSNTYKRSVSQLVFLHV